MYENRHRRSHVNPPNRGLLPPPRNFTYLRFQPIQTKFSLMTFDWNSSSELENGHHRSNVTPPNRDFCPPENSIIVIIFFFFFFFVCGHNNSLKAQPIRTKFSHKTFNWNSSDTFGNGHHRSHVTPLGRGLPSPSPSWKLTYLRFQPIQTKFSHMTFDWNSSFEFENGHHRSNVTP